MGGTSSSGQTQQSTTAPWAAAQPMLQSILGQLNPQIANSGLNPTESAAIAQLTQNAQAGNPYASAISSNASSLLSGGGALNQSPMINSAINAYRAQTNPLASNTNYDPRSTPGFSGALDALNSDITQNINGQFAAAGRDGSGYNSQTLARGLSQGEGQLLANQYNQNVQNQQGAAQNLFNAGLSGNSLLSGLQQQYVANQQAGTGAASSALSAQNYGPNATLQAQQLGQQIPAQNLGLLAQIGIPIGGLGGQSTGTSQGTQTMSGAQQFATILQGLGSLIPKGPTNFNFG